VGMAKIIAWQSRLKDGRESRRGKTVEFEISLDNDFVILKLPNGTIFTVRLPQLLPTIEEEKQAV
jgi:hypothetical protein